MPSSKSSEATTPTTKNNDEPSAEDLSSSEDNWSHSSLSDEILPRHSRSRSRRFVSKRHVPHGAKNVAVQTENDPPLQYLAGMPEKDFTVHLEMEIGLDINDDIEQLSRLNQLGYYNEASSLFHQRLAPHVDFFPVTAEYIDLCLEQGNFGAAQAFISARLNDMTSTFTPIELLLLRLLKAFVKIYTQGALIPALQMTRQTLRDLETEAMEDRFSFKSSIGPHIQIVETCMRIIQYAAFHSSFFESSTYAPLCQWGFVRDKFTFRKTSNVPYYNFAVSATPGEPTPGISSGTHMNSAPSRTKIELPYLADWYSFLVNEGYLWESHRLLQVLLPLMGDCEGRYYLWGGVFQDYFHLPLVTDAMQYFSGDGISVQCKDRQILTELANATLLAGFLNSYGSHGTDIHVRETRRHFFEKARSIAASIASEYPDLLKSRPYLNWLYLAETEISESYKKLDTSSSPLILPLVWSRDFLGGVQSLLSLSSAVGLASPAGTSASASTTNVAQEANLRIIMAVAEEQGDYKLQNFLLQALLNNCAVKDGRADIIKTMSKLRRGVMKDAAGYLQCLIFEWRFFVDSNPDVASETLINLHSRFTEFNDSYPSHFDFKPEERQRLKPTLFDVPIFVWMKQLATVRLLLAMERYTEADISRVRNPQIERHLPSHATYLLGLTVFRCEGCIDCGGDMYPYPYPPPFYTGSYYTRDFPDADHKPHIPEAVYSYPPPAGSRFVRGRDSPESVSSHDLTQRVSRPFIPPTGLPSRPVIGHEKHRYHTVDDDAARDAEEMIRSSRDRERRSQKEKPSRNSKEAPKRTNKTGAWKFHEVRAEKKGNIGDRADDSSSGKGYES
ncbi:hypothetical protein F1880_001749 [Penicillium rolfsii]|nr:hypothetical protein F1880_001749 [Penicillium rolfsii]